MPDEKQITNDVLSDKIVIRREYFTNIETAINSINEFFSSNFKTKNFPVRDGSFELDKCLETIIELIDNVDVTWITDQQKATEVLNEIFEVTDKMDADGYGSIYEALHNNGDTSTIQKIESFMGYYTLTTIADNFQDFSELVNGIYSFELFTKPSKYKSTIETFSKHINMEELESLFNEESNDIPSIFNASVYVDGVFTSEFIDVPETLNKEDELRRINEFRDSSVEVLIDENGDTVQEAATINFFENDIKSHIKYNDKQDKFQISKQYQKIVNDFISEIEKCDDTDELSKVFTNEKASKYPDNLMNVCVPFIICKVFNNKNKYPFDKFNNDELGKFTKSYKSIADKNPGAKRFVNYDLFSVFKTDKEGTVKFLQDYFTLNLYNDADAYISNNTILTLFNIFDSRIYFDILYNSIPDNLKKTKFNSEDKFVKDARAKINKNSRNANVYKSDNTKKASDAKDTKAVTEYVSDCLKEYGDMSITDMVYCEHYQSLIKEEIACIGDVMHNKNVSSNMIDKYIGESYNVVNEGFFDRIFEMSDKLYCKELIKNIEKLLDIELSNEYKKMIIKSADSINRVLDLNKNKCGFISIFSLHGLSKKYWTIGKYPIEIQLSDLDPDFVNKVKEYHNERLYPIGRFKLNISKDKSFSTVDDFIYSDASGNIYTNLFKNDPSGNVVKSFKNINDLINNINSKELNITEDFKNKKIDVYYIEEDRNKETVISKNVNLILDYNKNEIPFEYFMKFINIKRANTCISEYKHYSEIIKHIGDNDSTFNCKHIDVESVSFDCVKNILTHHCIVKKTGEKFVLTDKIESEHVFENIQESYVQESFFNNAGFLNLRSKIANALGSQFVVSNMMNPMGAKQPRFTIKNNEDADTTINIDSMGNAIAINVMKGYSMSPYGKGITLSAAFNKIISVIKELFPSTNVDTESILQEQETGDIPEYMRNRIQLTDEANENNKSNESEHRHAEASLNLGVDDLATSIDAKLAYGGDTLDESLGSGFTPSSDQAAKKAESQIVYNYNITNNYTNSFNKDSNNTTTNTTTNNDLSSNKQTTTTNNTTNTNSHNDSSRNKDNSQRKSISNIKPDNSRGINNNNNNTGKESNDTKDDINVDTPTFSNGKTIQEVFAFLESEEPLSDGGNAGAGEPPKSDLLTVAMDIDKDTLNAQQTAKQKLQKAVNTGKAFLKPVGRTKKWLTDIIDSLIKRDEDRVKAEIIENPSYRTALYKAMRLGIKLGLTGVCFTISGYLGAAYLVTQGAKYADKQRMKKEVQAEFGTEIEIINEKIQSCPTDTEEGRKAKYQMMRLKSKMEKMLADSPRSTFKSAKSAI